MTARSDRKLWALCAVPFVLDALAAGVYQVSRLAAGVMFCACFAYFPVVMIARRRSRQERERLGAGRGGGKA